MIIIIIIISTKPGLNTGLSIWKSLILTFYLWYAIVCPIVCLCFREVCLVKTVKPILSFPHVSGQWWKLVWSQWRPPCGRSSTVQQKIWRRLRRTWSSVSSPTAESSHEVSLRSSTTPPLPCCPSSPPCLNILDRTCSEKTSYVRTAVCCSHCKWLRLNQNTQCLGMFSSLRTMSDV